MKRFLRSSLLAFAGLAAGLVFVQAASADDVVETEPNDDIAHANQTVGFNNLGFIGSLTLGDMDTFSIRAIPNNLGVIEVAYDTFWSSGSNGSPFNKWLNFRIPDNLGGFAQGGLAGKTGSGSFLHSDITTPQIYYFQLFSTTPTPGGTGPIPGSMVTGDYSLTHIRGLNGTVVLGTQAVPEPGIMALLTGLGVSGGAWVVSRLRRRKK